MLGSVAAQGGHADGVGRAQARARAEAFARGQDILVEVNEMWTHWGLSPGPSACGADVIPLHHVPSDGIEFHTMNPNFGAPVDFSHGPLSMIKKGQAQKSFRQAGLDDDRGR